MSDNETSLSFDGLAASRKRILVISALFPPNVLGGAEMSAHNAAAWFAARGHDVSILTCAVTPDQVCEDKLEGGLRIWRVHMPRPYPVFHVSQAPAWLKPLWHLQDHFDPRNRRIMRRVLDAVRPEVVNIHILQGLGYNALRDLAKRDIRVTYVLHDLGLACVRMSMFKNGRNCSSQCRLCYLSLAYKASLIKRLKELRFVSPSQANFDKLALYFPVKAYPHRKILNPNQYPPASRPRVESRSFRILYAGRIHTTKGADLLLEAVERLAGTYDVRLVMVGDGPDRARLEARYGGKPWCVFTGFIPQAAISNYIVDSDIFCIPSIWAENSPGVAIHALQRGLPVVGSDIGGIPELVEVGRNGSLVAPGDVDAWAQEIERLLKAPDIVRAWRTYALDTAWRFQSDIIGSDLEDFAINENHV